MSFRGVKGRQKCFFTFPPPPLPILHSHFSWSHMFSSISCILQISPTHPSVLLCYRTRFNCGQLHQYKIIIMKIMLHYLSSSWQALFLTSASTKSIGILFQKHQRQEYHWQHMIERGKAQNPPMQLCISALIDAHIPDTHQNPN